MLVACVEGSLLGGENEGAGRGVGCLVLVVDVRRRGGDLPCRAWVLGAHRRRAICDPLSDACKIRLQGVLLVLLGRRTRCAVWIAASTLHLVVGVSCPCGLWFLYAVLCLTESPIALCGNLLVC